MAATGHFRRGAPSHCRSPPSPGLGALSLLLPAVSGPAPCPHLFPIFFSPWHLAPYMLDACKSSLVHRWLVPDSCLCVCICQGAHLKLTIHAAVYKCVLILCAPWLWVKCADACVGMHVYDKIKILCSPCWVPWIQLDPSAALSA